MCIKPSPFFERIEIQFLARKLKSKYFFSSLYAPCKPNRFSTILHRGTLPTYISIVLHDTLPSAQPLPNLRLLNDSQLNLPLLHPSSPTFCFLSLSNLTWLFRPKDVSPSTKYFLLPSSLTPCHLVSPSLSTGSAPAQKRLDLAVGDGPQHPDTALQPLFLVFLHFSVSFMLQLLLSSRLSGPLSAPRRSFSWRPSCPLTERLLEGGLSVSPPSNRVPNMSHVLPHCRKKVDFTDALSKNKVALSSF